MSQKQTDVSVGDPVKWGTKGEMGIITAIAMKEPNLTPFLCIKGHPGYPVRSNVIEVNGRFRRIKKWIGGRPGLLDRLSQDGPAKIDWFEELGIPWENDVELMEVDNGQETN